MKEEFDNYLQRINGEKGFNQLLARDRAPYNDFLNHLLRFYFFTSFLIDESKVSFNCDVFPLRTLYGDASLLLLGLYSCLKNGSIISASIIERSIFEKFVNVELILRENPEERIKLYGDFEYVEKWNRLQQYNRLLNRGVITQEMFDDSIKEKPETTEENYKIIRNSYHPKKPYHWAWKIFEKECNGKNPSLRFICEKLSREKEYVNLYSSISAITHGSPLTRNIMVVGNSASLAPCFSNLTIVVGTLGFFYCSEIIKNIIGYIVPSDRNRIETFIYDYFDEIKALGGGNS